MLKHTLITLLSLLFCISSPYAQVNTERKFANFDKGGGLVRTFFQDSKNIIWVCTSYGLGIFDGQGIHKHKVTDTDGTLKDLLVYCSLKKDDTHYYLGTGKGLILFDLATDTFRLLSTKNLPVRTIQRVNESVILLGTLNGLFKYDTKQNSFLQVTQIPQLPIDPIVKLDDSHFLIANYQGLYLYDAVADTYNFVSIPSKDSSLILSIAVDSQKQWAWIGTEDGLWKYTVSSGEFTNITSILHIPIKKIHISADGLLWLGTDNGLYIYNPQKDSYEHIVHSSTNANSLTNNIIWAIFEDNEQNIWLGTESGISLYYNSQIIETYSWSTLVGADEGNDILCTYHDSHGYYWWGGNNGLAYYNPAKNKSLWFKMNQGKHSISHNRVRWIYEDWDNDLWIATDGGINKFNYATDTFENFQIVDSTNTRNANWTYYINSDGHENLYLVSYCGGVFVINKKKLLTQKRKPYMANENYYHHQGDKSLHSNFVRLATMDNDGCLWVSSAEYNIDKIDFKQKKVYPLSVSNKEIGTAQGSIQQIVYDKSGYIWVALNACLCKISVEDMKTEIISDPILENKDIFLLSNTEERLWIGTSDGIYIYNKTDKKMMYTGIDGNWLSLYNDISTHKMWIGGTDHCIVFQEDELLDWKNEGKLVLSRLYVNDKPIYAHQTYNGNLIADKNINSINQIHLLHNQNNIAFNFFHTRYENILKPSYIYKLEGVDEDWRNLDDLSMHISYSNLAPGNYVFELKELNDKKDIPTYFRLNITIENPWYWTYWAKSIYALLTCLLILWVVKYFVEKNRYRIERIEKEKTLELSELKMEFLTNMSHELKTPLSLIISPSSKLLTETKNKQTKELLSVIHTNALKLNNIVHQILNVKDWGGTQQQLYLSQLEFVTFIKSIVQSFKENVKNKDISLHFHSEPDSCFVEVDISKMEAIVNNLLSNACKFSNEHGEVNIQLTLLEEKNDETPKVCLTVTDNGVGIPACELPHVAERFYQVSKNLDINKEGSGLGLSIVKKNIELHGGEIQIESEEGKGTSVFVYIPIAQQGESHIQKETTVALNAEDAKYKILIVEDNVEIAHFIMHNLRNAECLVAYNGKIGVEIAQQELPDIIIADIMMPVMNGIEMVKQIKTNAHTSTIPVILLTAKDDKKTEYDSLSLGVDVFLSKPFDMKELIIHIERLLRNKNKLVRQLKEEIVQKAKETDKVITESQDEKFMNCITKIIEQNISDSDLNVSKLSELSGHNTKMLYRRIKQLTGYTAVDYIKSIRMKKAAMLLSQKQFMISEVMYMVGFSDSSYFSKCFAEKYGKTPKQYIENR